MFKLNEEKIFKISKIQQIKSKQLKIQIKVLKNTK
jgi:hypothetical protein